MRRSFDSKRSTFAFEFFYPLSLYAAYPSALESGSTYLVDQWDILRSSSYCFFLWHLPSSSIGRVSDHTCYDLRPLAVRHFWVCRELFHYFLSSNHREFISLAIGYHRLYSHRSFRASFGVRAVLAVLGTLASEGSIKAGGHNLYSIPYAYRLSSYSGGEFQFKLCPVSNNVDLLLFRCLRHRLHHVCAFCCLNFRCH